MIDGAIGGLATMLALPGITVSLRWSHILLASAGWVIGFVLGLFVLISIVTRIGDYSTGFELVARSLAGAIAGAIGGAVTAWQIDRAQRS
jgi:hypothetical protein